MIEDTGEPWSHEDVSELMHVAANLRHMYRQMMNGVKDSAQAKRLAEGLLAPQIERLERLIT